MTPGKEFWGLIFIGGYLVVLEGGIVLLAKTINDKIPEHWLKIIVGVAIIIIAVIGLLSPPAPFLKPPTS